MPLASYLSSWFGGKKQLTPEEFAAQSFLDLLVDDAYDASSYDLVQEQGSNLVYMCQKPPQGKTTLVFKHIKIALCIPITHRNTDAMLRNLNAFIRLERKDIKTIQKVAFDDPKNASKATHNLLQTRLKIEGIAGSDLLWIEFEPIGSGIILSQLKDMLANVQLSDTDLNKIITVAFWHLKEHIHEKAKLVSGNIDLHTIVCEQTGSENNKVFKARFYDFSDFCVYTKSALNQVDVSKPIRNFNASKKPALAPEVILAVLHTSVEKRKSFTQALSQISSKGKEEDHKDAQQEKGNPTIAGFSGGFGPSADIYSLAVRFLNIFTSIESTFLPKVFPGRGQSLDKWQHIIADAILFASHHRTNLFDLWHSKQHPATFLSGVAKFEQVRTNTALWKSINSTNKLKINQIRNRQNMESVVTKLLTLVHPDPSIRKLDEDVFFTGLFHHSTAGINPVHGGHKFGNNYQEVFKDPHNPLIYHYTVDANFKPDNTEPFVPPSRSADPRIFAEEKDEGKSPVVQPQVAAVDNSEEKQHDLSQDIDWTKLCHLIYMQETRVKKKPQSSANQLVVANEWNSHREVGTSVENWFEMGIGQNKQIANGIATRIREQFLFTKTFENRAMWFLLGMPNENAIPNGYMTHLKTALESSERQKFDELVNKLKITQPHLSRMDRSRIALFRWLFVDNAEHVPPIALPVWFLDWVIALTTFQKEQNAT